MCTCIHIGDTTLTKELVAYYSGDSVVLLDGESETTIFVEGEVPEDILYNSLNRGLFVFYSILAVVGIVYACVWLVFELMFRKKKCVCYTTGGGWKRF